MDNVESIIAIHNKNVRSGRLETRVYKNSLTEEEAEIIRQEGFDVQMDDGVWIIRMQN